MYNNDDRARSDIFWLYENSYNELKRQIKTTGSSKLHIAILPCGMAGFFFYHNFISKSGSQDGR